MARWGTKLAGPILALAACTPTEFIRVPADAAAGADRPTLTDVGDGGRVVADAGTSARCTTDRECTGGVCDLGTQRCVQCVDSAQCMGGAVCLGSRCVQAPTCTTSRTCPGQVCSTRLGVCVDCETETDCSGGQVCRRNVCAPPPRTCMSSRECSDLGQVCDTARRLCVECLGDNDCAPEQHCGARQVCLSDACVAGASRCLDAATAVVCDARGAAENSIPCRAGERCRATRCEASACSPGSAACTDSTTRRVCDADGTAYTDATCPTGQRCVSGVCRAILCAPNAARCLDSRTLEVCAVDGSGLLASTCPNGGTCSNGICSGWTCVPGSVTCGVAPGTRVECNSDGTSTRTLPCPVPPNAASSACTGGVCGFSCSAGFSDCDGIAANGCESDLATSASNCGSCGRSCATGTVCTSSACVAVTNTSPAPMLMPRYGHGAVRLPDGRVMVIAGYGAGAYLASTEVYDPTSNRWQVGPALPVAVVHPAVTLGADGSVYVFGGDRGADGSSDGTFVLASAAGAWRVLAPLPTRRFGSYAEVVGSQILVGGGVGSENRADLYNPLSNTWARTADTNNAHIFAGHAPIGDGRAIVFGGFQSGTSQPTTSVEIFDPVSQRWSAGPRFPSPYGGMASVRTRAGIVHFAGGFAGAYVSAVETFSLTSSRYQSGVSLPAGRGYGALVELLDGGLLFIGGRSTETLGYTEVLALPLGAMAWR